MVRNKVVDAVKRWQHVLQPWAKLVAEEWKKWVKCMREDKFWGGTFELILVRSVFVSRGAMKENLFLSLTRPNLNLGNV